MGRKNNRKKRKVSRVRFKNKPPKTGNLPQNSLEVLEKFRLDFDCAVAVWVPGFEITHAFANYLLFVTSKLHVSECFKFGLHGKRIGVIYTFGSKDHAFQFYDKVHHKSPPYFSELYKAEILGTYLKNIGEIENDITSRHLFDRCCSKLIIRNLMPQKKVISKIIRLCEYFGDLIDVEQFEDVGVNFKFFHLVVSYPFAVQAFAAQLALDGKWIPEQKYPLAAEVMEDETVKHIYLELLKSDSLLFRCQVE